MEEVDQFSASHGIDRLTIYSFHMELYHKEFDGLTLPELDLVQLYFKWLARTTVGKKSKKCNTNTAVKWWKDLRCYFAHRLSLRYNREEIKLIQNVCLVRGAS